MVKGGRMGKFNGNIYIDIMVLIIWERMIYLLVVAGVAYCYASR